MERLGKWLEAEGQSPQPGLAALSTIKETVSMMFTGPLEQGLQRPITVLTMFCEQCVDTFKSRRYVKLTNTPNIHRKPTLEQCNIATK